MSGCRVSEGPGNAQPSKSRARVGASWLPGLAETVENRATVR